MPVPPIKIKAKVTPIERFALARSNQSFWVGFGYPDRRKSTRPRRYLRIRDENGICRYFLWTEPDKGKELICVARFKRRVMISWDKVMKHYNKNKK